MKPTEKMLVTYFKRHTQNYFHTLKIALALGLATFFNLNLQGNSWEDKGRGLKPISQEAIHDVEENWHVLVDVKPNKVGLERIRNHREANGLPPLFLAPASRSEEFVVVKGKSQAVLYQGTEAAISLPSHVDNSQLPSFPPIGDQQQLGSCVAWGTTYYQATHEYGLLNGINNKTHFHNVFSPKWTYNNLNGGVDEGLAIFDTYQLFSQNGLVSMESFPYDTNYRAWDLNPQDWLNALSYRSSPGHLIAGIGGDQQNLQVIKQLLNNGHVVTFGTFIDSWQLTTIKSDPLASTNPHADELAAAWMSGTDGGHCMTIVGYDDTVWIDVNCNNSVDPGEKGAFLVANSWGADWGNKGFVWVAYDAFLSSSAVPNGPEFDRVAIADAMNSYVITAVPISPHYSPKLIAQFSLSQTIRNQISVSVGISDISANTPSKVFNSYALVNQGGDLEFDGTSPHGLQTATFALDLTDLLPAVSAVKKRFYLLVKDNKIGSPTTIKSFDIIDKINNKIIKGLSTSVTFDNSQDIIFVDYDPRASTPPSVTPAPAPILSQGPLLTIISPLNNQEVGQYVWLGAFAQDHAGIERVEFYVDSTLAATDKKAPYYLLYETTKLSPGTHVLTVIAYNEQGESASETTCFNIAHHANAY